MFEVEVDDEVEDAVVLATTMMTATVVVFVQRPC
jgi:hypothetical protein